MTNKKLVTVPIRFPADFAQWILTKAEQCGLTPDQFASALVVIAFDKIIPKEPPSAEPARIGKPAKPATKAKRKASPRA